MEETSACRSRQRLWRIPIAEPINLKPLHAKIGQLTLENDFLESALTKAGLLSVRKWLTETVICSISRQAELLGFSRGKLYYTSKPISESELALMHAIDKLHMAHPFMGARMLRHQCQRDGFNVGRQHVRTLMRRMGIHAIYRKPRNTSGQNPEHKIYPYLLRGKQIVANQVWALDWGVFTVSVEHI